MSLTGRFNFKKTWRGKLNLVVEEEYRSNWGGEKRRWRAATLADLAEPEMRTLIDLRYQRKFGPLATKVSEAGPASATVIEAPQSSSSIIPFRNVAGVAHEGGEAARQ